MEASKENGKLGGRPKKPSTEPKGNLDKTPLTPTPTTTPKTTPVSYAPLFLKFWDKIANKVSKGTAEKNYMKLEDEWIEKPEELAEMYNKYYKSVEDKKFAKQPAYWLSAKKYEDEKPKAPSTDKVDMYSFRLKEYKKVIQEKKSRNYVSQWAVHNLWEVEKAIKESEFTKEEAETYLDLKGWL